MGVEAAAAEGGGGGVGCGVWDVGCGCGCEILTLRVWLLHVLMFVSGRMLT